MLNKIRCVQEFAVWVVYHFFLLPLYPEARSSACADGLNNTRIARTVNNYFQPRITDTLYYLRLFAFELASTNKPGAAGASVARSKV